MSRKGRRREIFGSLKLTFAQTPMASEKNQTAGSVEFLSGDGEMARLMRGHDWSKSSLGSPENWPQSLRTAVRLMLTTGHPMYIWWGHDGACLYNDAYRLSIGPERHPSSLGRPAREVWEEIWEIIGPQIEQVRSGGPATWHENQLIPITRNGRRENVYWTYSYGPIDDPASFNGIGGVLVICTETTSTVMAERRLAEQITRQRRLFQQAPSFIAMLEGPEHRISFANTAYMRLVGDRPVIGRTVAEALPEAAAQGYVNLLDSVFRSGTALTSLGARYVTEAKPGGAVRERYVDFVYQPVDDEDGRVTGIFVEGHDVTAQKEAEIALSNHAALREQFIAVLGHDLRNPLAAISGGMNLLLKTSLDEKARVIVDLVRGSATRMAALIDNVMDFARGRLGGGLPLERSAAGELEPLLRQVVAELQTSAPDRVIDIRVSVTEPVDCDRARIGQLVSNLVGNAIDHGAPDQPIQVTAATQDGSFELSVTNAGEQIPPASLDHIFDPYTRGIHRTSRQGLGLGLYISNEIAKAHGGTLDVISTVDQTSFTFRMPSKII
jgi:signal transduction histidine kinase